MWETDGGGTRETRKLPQAPRGLCEKKAVEKARRGRFCTLEGGDARPVCKKLLVRPQLPESGSRDLQLVLNHGKHTQTHQAGADVITRCTHAGRKNRYKGVDLRPPTKTPRQPQVRQGGEGKQA